ncbi:MAG: phosphatidate cytidylyltransferase [Chitinivibrionia bacterium]|nr:phosphatidate cytidylyltransferase [Chitinivibrionia bacterium]
MKTIKKEKTENKGEKRTLKNIGKRMFFVAWAAPLALFLINSQINLLPFLFGDRFDGIIKPIYPSTILAFLIILLAAKEYFGMLKTKFRKNWFWLGYIWLFISMCGSIVNVNILSFQNSLYILFLLIAFEAFFIGKGTLRWRRASLFFVGVVFLSIAGDALLKYLEPSFMSIWAFPITNQFFAANLGLITILTAIFFCDGAAYIVGSLFGKHKLSDISPKKTIEGSIGGFLFSVAIMTIIFALFGNPQEPIWLGVMLGVVIGIFAQVGDLFFSLTKRYFAVKDTSDLIPGHGGILDRFDSVLFVSPFVHIVITLANNFG